MAKPGPILKLIGLFLGLGLFGWIVADAFAKTQSVDWPPLPLAELAVASVLVLLAHGLHGVAWALGARKIAPQLGWTEGVAAYSVSFLGRYLPGKIWQVGGLSYLARGRGADPMQIAGYSLAFLIAFQVVGALLLLLSYLLQDYRWGWIPCVASAPVIGIALAAFYHVFSDQIFKRLPAALRARLRGALHQPFDALAMNLTLLAVVWLLLSSCGHLIVTGFAPDWNGTWGQSAAATLGGLIAGFLVLIAPSGAGVRESTIAIWLTAVGVDPVVAIAIVIALRVTMTLGELLWAAAGLLLFARTSPKPTEN
ncbi:uncharacterized membrane protein YbhN (UPF0104 family) [Rhodovulum iodosum]|uniref:Uncharacterized membrane protein YbhN (UPF0104 family) n=1 Tax=Rhodovulum iodosum TaxID=68291 RepID=A0ABV3XSQ0_9RHOB|nr:lysylphosphatidylglycerol synthase domain-containing protein [Rhodovulum robiginosum]